MRGNQFLIRTDTFYLFRFFSAPARTERSGRANAQAPQRSTAAHAYGQPQYRRHFRPPGSRSAGQGTCREPCALWAAAGLSCAGRCAAAGPAALHGAFSPCWCCACACMQCAVCRHQNVLPFNNVWLHVLLNAAVHRLAVYSRIQQCTLYSSV